MPYTDFELMQLQAEALFVHDADGRLLRINEPEPTQPAPRFFLGRTAAGSLGRTRFDLPAGLAAELARLAADEPVSGSLHAPPKHDAEYRALLGQHAPIRSVYSGPAYRLPDAQPPGRAQMLTAANLAAVESHFAWLLPNPDDYAPVAFIASEGAAVAVCFSSRIAAKVCEAGVFTVEAYRGRGYAADVVRGWAATVRAAGKTPLYSTSWENLASQAVARRLGAAQYGTDFSIT